MNEEEINLAIFIAVSLLFIGTYEFVTCPKGENTWLAKIIYKIFTKF